MLSQPVRLQIWDLNEPGPRTVKVHYDVSIGKFYTTTPSPASLLICQESRYELLNRWKLHFGTLGHPATVRVNLDIDTVQLDSNPLRMGAISRSDRHSIRHLEVGGRELQYIHADVFLASIVHIPNLQDLTIVSPPPHPGSLDVRPLPQGDCTYCRMFIRIVRRFIPSDCTISLVTCCPDCSNFFVTLCLTLYVTQGS